jgi:hypothetical protein
MEAVNGRDLCLQLGPNSDRSKAKVIVTYLLPSGPQNASHSQGC